MLTGLLRGKKKQQAKDSDWSLDSPQLRALSSQSHRRFPGYDLFPQKKMAVFPRVYMIMCLFPQSEVLVPSGNTYLTLASALKWTGSPENFSKARPPQGPYLNSPQLNADSDIYLVPCSYLLFFSSTLHHHPLGRGWEEKEKMYI